MLARIQPDALRWLLVGANVALTALLGWCALYAFNFNKTVGVALKDKSWYNPVEGYAHLSPDDVKGYKIPERSAPPPVAGKPQSIALAFEPLPPPPPEEENTEESAEESPDVAALDGGPLSDKWALESVFETEGKAQLYAFLSEKPPEAKPAGPTRAATSFPASRLTTSSYRRPPAAAKTQTKQKVLRIYDADVNAHPVEIGERAIFFVEAHAKPLAILYTEVNLDPEGSYAFDPKATRYMLKKEEEPYDPFVMIGRDQDEDPNAPARRPAPQADPDSRGSLSVGGKTLQTKSPAPEEAPAAGPPKAGGRIISNSPAARSAPPSAKDVRELKSALNDMKKHIPPEELKKLNEAARGRGK